MDEARAGAVLLKMLQRERHAGPGFCKSPPPDALPLPSFLSGGRSGASSPSPPPSPVSVLSFGGQGSYYESGGVITEKLLLDSLRGKRVASVSDAELSTTESYSSFEQLIAAMGSDRR